MKIEESVAIITGGAQGIGKAVAISLLKLGAKVCIADVNSIQGENTIKELGQVYEDSVIFQQCDVTKEDDIRSVFKVTKNRFGDVTIMVNNAGILDEQNWTRLVAINFEAQIRCTMTALEFMGCNNGGRGGLVIFTSSIVGVIPIGTFPVYAAAKHGIVGFVRSMAMSPRQNDWGVRFNAVCPSSVETGMTTEDNFARAITDPVVLDKVMQDNKNTYNDKISPSEVAETYVRIIKDDALNGKTLVVLKGKTTFVDAAVVDM
ncbi:unnamed protein product [Owenia fusiformis]|uniref:15-hydroxyprostaglandin dehydrogenase [NAD(+)] n=1 Tax=Owenia fusiformis TaxID=6347 RepID=A0A8J1XKK7_OWEFU|nr:unnamed protein product [Owenia fusiformis]